MHQHLSRFWCVLKCLSVVWLLLLSSTRFHIVVLYSERGSFHKIRGEKFEPGSGLSHEAMIFKIHENSTCGHVWDVGDSLGSCAARNVKNYMACRDGFAKASLKSNTSLRYRAHIAWILVGKNRFKNFTVLRCALVSVGRLHFPFVQYEFISQLYISNGRASTKFVVKKNNRDQVWAMRLKIWKFMKIQRVDTSGTWKIRWGVALRAIFKSIWLVETVSQNQFRKAIFLYDTGHIL